ERVRSRRRGRLGADARAPAPVPARAPRTSLDARERKPAGGGAPSRAAPSELRPHAARPRRRRSRLMPTWPRPVSRVATAALLAGAAGAAYLGLFALVQMAIGPATAWICALLAATVLGALFGFLQPVRRRAERWLETTLSAQHVRARERIRRAVR